MGTIAALKLFLFLARWFAGQITAAQLAEAKLEGHELGVLQSFKLWSDEIDEKVKAARAAGDDVASGRVRVDPGTDPFNRNNRGPKETGKG